MLNSCLAMIESINHLFFQPNMMAPYLLFAIIFPFAISPFFFLFRNLFPRHLGFIALFVSLLSLTGIFFAGSVSGWNEPQVMTVSWVPSLGINFTFITDGLSLFFGILVTAMGVLICWYAQYYMDSSDIHLGRFYACLTFFMGAMLGTVFASNLMILFLFWELTGIASFLLIGYWHPKAAACKGARMALLVTSLGSLALLAGIIMLEILTGTFEWHTMATHGVSFKEHADWTYPIIICFLIGIFGKSAQFPFYFWLPNAMVAPTPVSAYLHAATMVKLGIFLTARMYPLFVAHEIWYYMLISFSVLTLLLGAVLSLLSHDLKAILAYATVSQLGFFLGLYGIGGEEGIEYDFVHILNHAFYKGSLFMLVGIVEHATGIRDVRRLGGLWSQLPLATIIFFIAAAAMAGIPGTTGFLSKELMLTEIFALDHSLISAWLILGAVMAASIFKVAIAIRIFYHIFVRETENCSPIQIVHRPSLAIQLPPLILSSIAFLFGILPTPLEHLTSYFYVSGLHKADPNILSLWHGWTDELAISFIILTGGAVIFYVTDQTVWRWSDRVIKFDPGDGFEWFVNQAPRLSRSIANQFEPASYQTQLALLYSLFAFGLGGFLLYHSSGKILIPPIAIAPMRILIIFIICLFTLLVALFKNLTAKLLSLSGCGFFIAIYFMLYEAPDLAMTQILVEVATSLLILLFFRHLKMEKDKEPSNPARKVYFTIPLSIACGLTACLLLVLYQSEDRPMLGFFLRNSLLEAHGSNVVNTILIDFRGLDTMGESTVLLTAMLGIIGLLTNKKALFFKEPHPKVPIDSSILHSTMPLIFILLNLFSIYLLLRGHHEPGGGFIAGLASGIAIIIFGLTNRAFKNFPLFVNLGFAGLSLLILSGLIPVFLGGQFLTHFMNFSSLPWLTFISSLTPLIFDSGVYLIVLAMAAKIYFLLRNVQLQRPQDGI